jgi:hypothetical protein
LIACVPDARYDVGCAARRERHDEADRLRRVGIGGTHGLLCEKKCRSRGAGHA